MGVSPESFQCRICLKDYPDKTSLVEHLRLDHEILEVASYAASTMIQEEERDRTAREFFRQLEHIKKEIASS